MAARSRSLAVRLSALATSRCKSEGGRRWPFADSRKASDIVRSAALASTSASRQESKSSDAVDMSHHATTLHKKVGGDARLLAYRQLARLANSNQVLRRALAHELH